MLTELVSLFLLSCAVLLWLPVTLLFVQVLAATRPLAARPLAQGQRPVVAVLVPAHNEAQGIAAALNSVSSQLTGADRLLVVADNCADDTARVATLAGAEVVERTDKVHVGKGYALDYGIRHLERTPQRGTPAVLVMVDADCIATPGAINQIAQLSASSGRPVQATYLMQAVQPASVLASIAEFAWLVKNKVRPLGAHRLGLPCHLMGSGMAFPWPAICAMPLASGHIVEDMKLGLDFARAGTPPLFCPGALVLSRFPTGASVASGQRTRWEHGHLGLIVKEAPGLLLDGLRGRGASLLALAFDLCVPPLALLVFMAFALFAAAALFALVTGVVFPALVAGLSVLALVVAVGLCWWYFGRELLAFSALLLAPIYVLRKLPLYLKFLVRRQATWVRAKRDGD